MIYQSSQYNCANNFAFITVPPIIIDSKIFKCIFFIEK